MPNWKSEIQHRLAPLHLAPTRERAIIEELAQDLDDCYAEWLARGATAAAAYQQALAELSDHEVLARELRRVEDTSTQDPLVLGTNRRSNMFADLWQDLRYGARTLAKQPSFTLLVVLTLGLGIAINTAVYSVADAILFRPLPFAQPEQLIEIWQKDPDRDSAYPGLRWEAFAEWRQQREVFAQVEAYAQRSYTLTGGAEPLSVTAPAVTAELFAMLGVKPQIGRLFQASDAEPGNSRAALLSDGFWRKHFGGSTDAIGKTITLNEQPYTVVGVMPPQFKFPYGAKDLWVPLPLAATDEQKRPVRFQAVARLRAGLSATAAQAALNTISAQLNKEKPHRIGWDTKLRHQDERRANPGPRRALLVLLGAVGFVLLLACANAANLLLARAAKRQGEIAIRLALGAGRGRLLRQLLTESLLLALLSGAAGLVLAWFGVAWLGKLLPNELTFLSVHEISIERRVMFFTFGLTLLTGLLFGLLPAWKASRPDVQQALKATGKAMADRAQNRLRNALVVIEVALSLVLLMGAGLLMRSFVHLANVPPGFDPHNVVAATMNLSEQRYATLTQETEFYQKLKENLASVPGVEAVTTAAGVPPQGGGIRFNLAVEVEGRAPEPPDPKLILPFSQVDPEYFQTLRIPLLRGRSFGAEDTVNAPPAIIINEEMARRYWPNENPVGQRLRFSKEGKWYTVVGVVGAVTIGSPGDGFSRMAVYYPWSQETRRAGQRALIVRTRTDANQLLNPIKSAIWALDKDQPIYRIDTVENLLSDALAEPRFYLLLFGCFAALTLLLVAMGIYGVMAYAVAQRTHEIGIRMALGAARRDVLALVLKQGLGLTLLGVGIGFGATLALSKLIAALLFGLPAMQPLVFGLTTLLLLGVALLACYLPARRAMNVNPLEALRWE